MYAHVHTYFHTTIMIIVITLLLTLTIPVSPNVTGFTKTVLNRTFGNSRNTNLKY